MHSGLKKWEPRHFLWRHGHRTPALNFCVFVRPVIPRCTERGNRLSIPAGRRYQARGQGRWIETVARSPRLRVFTDGVSTLPYKDRNRQREAARSGARGEAARSGARGEAARSGARGEAARSGARGEAARSGARGSLPSNKLHRGKTVPRGDQSTHNAVVAYLSGLTLAGGDHDGEAFNVLSWERRFARGAFRDRGTAALSLARGNGKSALVAGIAAAVVDPAGPLHGHRREAVGVASSFSQARIIFEDVLGFLRGKGYHLSDRKFWRVQDSVNRATVEYLPTGARVRCIGSDPKRAHGLRPFLVLADEPAQWEKSRAERMFAALKTGMGKVPNSKLIALGLACADIAKRDAESH